MKKLIVLLVCVTLLSCEGPQGPPGLNGVNILGNVFEANVNFNPNNDYSAIVPFPNNIQVFDSDIVMVYLLDGQVNGSADIWTPLPRSFFFNDGLQVVYNFDHTSADVNLFLDGNINLNTLGPAFTNNQIFRIAILPANFAEEFNVDIEDYSQVHQTLLSQDPDFKILSN